MKHAGKSARLAILIALVFTGLFNPDRSGALTNPMRQPRSSSISHFTNTIDGELLSRRSASITGEQSKARVREVYGKLPLRFEVNAGQTAREVKFLSRGSGYNLFLTPAEAVLALNNRKSETDTEPQSIVRMRFAGANPA